MKAIITGGAGFIGSHLVERLGKLNWDITIIDNLTTGRIENIANLNTNYKFINADISYKDESWTEELKQADYVFHLASLADIVPSIEKPLEYYESNVTGTINVLSECEPKRLKKFVYAASSSCYGITNVIPTPEDAPIQTEYPYALTKYLGEQITMHWGKVYGMKVVSTRFFNVYGTRSRTSGTYGAVFGVFLAQRLANKPLTIVGDGTQKRDFTYVTDVAKGIYQAAVSNYENEIFNLGSGKAESINKLADLIGGDRTYIPKRPGEPEITHSDISKAKELLNYEPVVSFEEGVKLVLENMEYWRDAPVWTPETINQATRTWFDSLQ
ncbi:MAG: NAD-dependent dehydratase [Pelagibacteraceae bacterium TMED65]|jgi:UDP-glucose 4-epimerase|nr:MAG: NAD-dependent dehydratase [Pelagibacteraceae bacterium TMED65]|tara:strand:+ start:1036 stop:2016 length:981 start_codon:yes stop_codon:yes gene_type:complete